MAEFSPPVGKYPQPRFRGTRTSRSDQAKHAAGHRAWRADGVTIGSVRSTRRAHSAGPVVKQARSRTREGKQPAVLGSGKGRVPSKRWLLLESGSRTSSPCPANRRQLQPGVPMLPGTGVSHFEAQLQESLDHADVRRRVLREFAACEGSLAALASTASASGNSHWSARCGPSAPSLAR